MTELRQKMIECLQLNGLSERTQEAYFRAVRKLAEPADSNVRSNSTKNRMAAR